VKCDVGWTLSYMRWVLVTVNVDLLQEIDKVVGLYNKPHTNGEGEKRGE